MHSEVDVPRQADEVVVRVATHGRFGTKDLSCRKPILRGTMCLGFRYDEQHQKHNLETSAWTLASLLRRAAA